MAQIVTVLALVVLGAQGAAVDLAVGDLLESWAVRPDAGSSSSLCLAWDFTRRLRSMGLLLEITILDHD